MKISRLEQNFRGLRGALVKDRHEFGANRFGLIALGIIFDCLDNLEKSWTAFGWLIAFQCKEGRRSGLRRVEGIYCKINLKWLVWNLGFNRDDKNSTWLSSQIILANSEHSYKWLATLPTTTTYSYSQFYGEEIPRARSNTKGSFRGHISWALCENWSWM